MLPFIPIPSSFSYNKYLAPLAPSEVNVEHAVRSDVTTYVQTNLAEAAQLAKKRHEAREIYAGGSTMTASQLQTMLVLFERVQGQTFRLMASDSIPKVPPPLVPFHSRPCDVD